MAYTDICGETAERIFRLMNMPGNPPIGEHVITIGVHDDRTVVQGITTEAFGKLTLYRPKPLVSYSLVDIPNELHTFQSVDDTVTFCGYTQPWCAVRGPHGPRSEFNHLNPTKAAADLLVMTHKVFEIAKRNAIFLKP